MILDNMLDLIWGDEHMGRAAFQLFVEENQTDMSRGRGMFQSALAHGIFSIVMAGFGRAERWDIPQ